MKDDAVPDADGVAAGSDGADRQSNAGAAHPAAVAGSSCPSCGNPLGKGGVCSSCAPTRSVNFEDDLRVPGHLLLGTLGAGGMGRVYLAEDTNLQRRVAIKVMKDELLGRPGAADRFLREARTMAAVDHPNVVRIISMGKTGARSYIVMEYVDGEGLDRLLAREGPLPLDTSMGYLRQTIEALQAAWTHGIIHRDIKPSNLLIDKKDQIRMTDFGLAKAVDSTEAVSLTDSGLVIGTPMYIAPEQARSQNVDFRTDFYSLGIVLFEMLAGRPPYRGKAVNLVEQHLHAVFPALRDIRGDVPEALEQLCEWMTKKDPVNRPESHGALLKLIDDLVGGGFSASSLPDMPVPEVPFTSLGTGETPAATTDETPVTPLFVGRKDELHKLARFQKQSLEGNGRVAFVTGEAGSGKTTLVAEFARRCGEHLVELVVVQGNCDARTGTGDPFLPFREVLAQLTGDVETRVAAGALSRAQARRLWVLFPRAAEIIADRGPDLVGTFLPSEPLLTRARERAPGIAGWRAGLAKLAKKNAAIPPDLRPQQSELLDQFTQVLVQLSRIQPILLIVEDLHWLDTGSAALLQHLGHALQGARILVIGTYRPEEVEAAGDGGHPLQPVVHDLRARLGDLEIPVGQEEGREFVDAYLDSRPNSLDQAFREELFHRTHGHSLFLVELVRDLQERGMLVKDDDGLWSADPSLDWDLLPSRIEGVIGARMERLPEAAREVLRLASIEGEEFTAEVVAEALSLSPREAVRLLAKLDRRHRLVRAREVRRVSGHRLSRYGFRHILFQKYLYDLLDPVERSYLHEQVGEILEQLHGDARGEIAEALAAHFEAAGLIEKAVDYLQQAGERAGRLSSDDEAVKHLRHALELLNELVESRERTLQEIDIQFSLVSPLHAKGGANNPELEAAMERALELCDEVGDARRSFMAIHSLMSCHGVSGRLREAHELGERLFELSKRSGDPLLDGMAHWNLGFVLFWQGRHAEAIEHLEVMMDMYNIDEHQHLGLQFGFDPGVCSTMYWTYSQWFLGHPKRAMEGQRRLFEFSRRVEHLNSQLIACNAVTAFAVLVGDVPTLRAGLALFLRLLPESGITQSRGGKNLLSGWLRAEEGDLDGGIEQMRRGAEQWGVQYIDSGKYALFIGEMLLKAGRHEEALATVDTCLQRFETFEDRPWQPPLHCLRGDLILAMDGPQGDAEEAYRRSEELAQSQGARSWLLRTAMSQARLLRRQGKTRAAHHKLQQIYGTFTEGFDTADLRAAKQLLEELGES